MDYTPVEHKENDYYWTSEQVISRATEGWPYTAWTDTELEALKRALKRIKDNISYGMDDIDSLIMELIEGELY